MSKNRYKCTSCGGEYASMVGDGVYYFHVCPTGTPSRRDENWVFTVVDVNGIMKVTRRQKMGKTRRRGGAKKI